MCSLQTISAHPSIPNLVVGVDLATFLLPSGQMCHVGGAGRYLSGFRADPVFPRVFQGGIPTAGMGCGGVQLLWCEQWMDIGGCDVWSRSQVDVQATGESIQLGAQSPWAETDSEVKLN